MNGFDELIFEEGVGGGGDTHGVALCQVPKFHTDAVLEPNVERGLPLRRPAAVCWSRSPVARSGGLCDRARVDGAGRAVVVTALILPYRPMAALGCPRPAVCTPLDMVKDGIAASHDGSQRAAV